MSVSIAARRLVHCLPSPPAPAPTDPNEYSIYTMYLISIVFYLLLNIVIIFVAYLCDQRRNHRLNRHEEELTPEKLADAMEAMQVPLVLFSEETTKLAWLAKQCSICLMEFAEGDALRVLPACNHGFHGPCVEQWLASKGLCPNCRRQVRKGVRRGRLLV